MARVDRHFARAFAALISALATLFVLSQVYRNTNALIAPELAVELGLSPAALGGMGAVFFFTIYSGCDGYSDSPGLAKREGLGRPSDALLSAAGA